MPTTAVRKPRPLAKPVARFLRITDRFGGLVWLTLRVGDECRSYAVSRCSISGDVRWSYADDPDLEIRYLVRQDGKRLTCDCPSGSRGRPCKHKDATIKLSQINEIN
jgi:hypothetical protein